MEFLQNYGYLAVFLGSTIEGELILVLAGYLAYAGVLKIEYVILNAFLGTLIADQGCFILGRYYGEAILKRFPILRKKSSKVFALMHKYQNMFIMSFRFVYGIRIASPILLGASKINPKKFAVLNVPAALIWSITIAFVGYFFGGSIDIILDNIHKIQRYGLLVGLPFGLSVWLAYKLYVKRYK